MIAGSYQWADPLSLVGVWQWVPCRPVDCSCAIDCGIRSLFCRSCAMRIPVGCGVIDRRILVNWHVDPKVLAALLPAPFRPKVIHGVGMVGICLIRLKRVRPSSFPSWLGISSENAAHRTAVEWDDHGMVREGVYVRR